MSFLMMMSFAQRCRSLYIVFALGCFFVCSIPALAQVTSSELEVAEQAIQRATQQHCNYAHRCRLKQYLY
ncbi:hypothetical protein C5H23_06970 [Xylella fastidiosa]|nr:hypothetical protein C5H23_06970 [Xylella fastidiosa]